MASDERGTKRQCLHCGMKYYDLNRDPILCPGCQKPFEQPAEPAPSLSKAKANDTAAKSKETKTEVVEKDPGAKVAGAEVVSFEDAETEQDDDSEETGSNIPDVEGVEDIGGEVDNAFVESDDDEDDAEIGFGVNTKKTED